jgi:hypothetical protein
MCAGSAGIGNKPKNSLMDEEAWTMVGISDSMVGRRSKVLIASVLFLMVIAPSWFASAESVSLDPSTWQVFSPWGGSAKKEATADGVRFYGSGNRQGTQTLSNVRRDLRNSTTYIKWRVHGPSGSYAVWGVGLGWRYVGDIAQLDVYGCATAGWTIPKHGAGFSTDHSYLESKVINDDTWYFTRIDVSMSRAVSAVTATGNYDTSGGTDFYSYSYNLSEEDWQALSRASVIASFHDNYGGANAWLEIGEAKAVMKTDALLLSVSTAGTTVSLSWTPVAGATSYILYYALPDYQGEIDINTVGSISLGSATSLSATLWSGAVLYAAILSMNGTVPQMFSNIEQFMTFGGETIFPETGNILMEIHDPGGLGTATFIGTETNGTPDLPLTEYQIDTGADTLRVTVDEAGRPLTFVAGNGSLSFVYHADETFDYEYLYNGALFASGSSQALMSVSSGPESNLIRPKSEGVDCTQSREDYEKSLDQDDRIKDYKRYIGLLYYVAIVIEKDFMEDDRGPDFTMLYAMMNFIKGHMERFVRLIDKIKNQKLADYDKDCGSTEFSCGQIRFSDTDAPDDYRVGHIYNWDSMSEISLISGETGVVIKYYYDYIDFVADFCSNSDWGQAPSGTCQRASDLELLGDESVYVESLTNPLPGSYDPTVWYTRYRLEGRFGGHVRIQVMEVNAPPGQEWYPLPLSDMQSAYRQAREVVLSKCGQQTSN